MTMPKIRDRFAAVQHQLHGWWDVELCRVVEAINDLQTVRGLTGWIVEFGVFHGRSLAALALAASENDWVLGVDCFASPEANSSGSGGRSSIDAARHAIQLVGVRPDRVSLVARNLTELDAYGLERLMEGLPGGKLPIRLAHIDAGHEMHQTTQDLETIVPHLDDLGAILLDDVFNHQWPEVGLAFAQFLRTHAGWDVVGCFHNRVLLVRSAAGALYRAALEPLYGRPWQSFLGKPYFTVP
jgi:predicted O-methyltransferase YrrM